MQEGYFSRHTVMTIGRAFMASLTLFLKEVFYFIHFFVSLTSYGCDYTFVVRAGVHSFR